MSGAKPSAYQVLVQPKHQLTRIISFQRWLLNSNLLGRRPLSIILSWVTHALYGCEISTAAEIPRSAKFPHPVGIVIGAGVVLGERVVIYQNVTLGSHGNPRETSAYPRIAADVVIYAGAVVVGGITVGAGATIGANAVVSEDVPDGSVLLAPKPNIRRAGGKSVR